LAWLVLPVDTVVADMWLVFAVAVVWVDTGVADV